MLCLMLFYYNAPQEDYITAMAKMQELHGVLNMKGMLHRQVQGRESDSFLALFNPLTWGITTISPEYSSGNFLITIMIFSSVWEGSSDYSFRSTHIKRNNYSARLLMFFKPDPHLKQIIVKEVKDMQMNISESPWVWSIWTCFECRCQLVEQILTTPECTYWILETDSFNGLGSW